VSGLDSAVLRLLLWLLSSDRWIWAGSHVCDVEPGGRPLIQSGHSALYSKQGSSRRRHQRQLSARRGGAPLSTIDGERADEVVC
jgi:hypothetical protein